MMKAALYAAGRIVIADSHLAASQKLSESERQQDLVSGFFDPESHEFVADMEQDHFYDKELYLVRHGPVEKQALTQQGCELVRQRGEELSSENWEGFRAYTSPFLRCLQTAAILSGYLPLNFTVLPCLGEQEESDFTEKIKDILRQLPVRSIVITHGDLICGIARMALCDNKVQQLRNGIPTAGIVHIKRHEVTCKGWPDAQDLQD